MAGISPASEAITIAPAERRVPGIDVLRGLCIIAVVLHHINLRIRFHESSLGKLIGPAADRVLFWSGYYGVRVFFVISGFLIASWSLKRWGVLKNIGQQQFYLMRFARIMPCLLGLLALFAVLDLASVPRFTINPQRTSLARALFAALTFHINWLEARTGYLPGGWDVLWSLSVEEVFYIFFPLVCFLVRRQVPLIALLSVFVIIGPFTCVLTHNDIWADYSYLSCMDGIAFGCMAALLAAKVKFNYKGNLALRISGILLCLLIDVFRHTAARLGFYKAGLDVTVLEIGTCLLVIALQQQFESKAVQSPTSTNSAARLDFQSFWRILARYPSIVLRWFGRNSYEIFLTHMLVLWPMVLTFQYSHQSINMAPLWFIFATALAGALGQVISQFYSEPLNRSLRRRLAPRASRAAAMPASSPHAS